MKVTYDQEATRFDVYFARDVAETLNDVAERLANVQTQRQTRRLPLSPLPSG